MMEVVDKYYLYTDDPNVPIGVYPGSCQGPDVYYFDSVERARNSNCHGVYADKVKYKIGKMEIQYRPVEHNIDPPTAKEIKEAEVEATKEAIREAKIDVWRKEWIAKHGEEPDVIQESDYRFVMMVNDIFDPPLLDIMKQNETNPSR